MDFLSATFAGSGAVLYPLIRFLLSTPPRYGLLACVPNRRYHPVRWKSTAPLVVPQNDATHFLISIKDPTISFEDGVTPWSSQVSHGEMIRDTNDERMILDPNNLQFLYQGISDADNRGDYGALAYKIGLLRAVKE